MIWTIWGHLKFALMERKKYMEQAGICELIS